MDQNYVKQAVNLLGGQYTTAAILGISQVAVSKMVKRGRLPRTEATGETRYAEKMARANPKINKKKLLSTVYRNERE